MVQPIRLGAIHPPSPTQGPSVGSDARRGEAFAEEVSLSSAALRLRDTQSLLRGLLTPLESPAADPELEAEREAYLESISDETDASAEATAERILGGITGYIYSAFRRARPELDRGDLAHFESEVRRGFERGLAQVADLLEALRPKTPDSQIREGQAAIDVTRGLVYQGLDDFLARERERLSL